MLPDKSGATIKVGEPSQRSQGKGKYQHTWGEGGKPPKREEPIQDWKKSTYYGRTYTRESKKDRV